MIGESYKCGWFSVSGVRGSLEELVQFVYKQDLSFLVLGEMWLKAMGILRHLSIVFDLRHPAWIPVKGVGFTVL